MPRFPDPGPATQSKHWIREAINTYPDALNSAVKQKFGWDNDEKIEWLSPIKSDDYAEYSDQEFLTRLGVAQLKVPLSDFWPRGGPHWDGIGRIKDSGKLILVEAKAHIEESVDFGTDAELVASLTKIKESLASAKTGFAASVDAPPWDTPFYQYTNRLAHLYFLRRLNGLDAKMLFLYFADAPDVRNPCTVEGWRGAEQLTKKCLGLGKSALASHVKSIIWRVPDMQSRKPPAID